MDIFDQINSIDSIISEEEDKKKQEELFQSSHSSALDFLTKDEVWQDIQLELPQKSEKEKLKPLTSGFGPWSW